MASYNYTIATLAIDRLTQEIEQSAIITALDHITGLGVSIDIFFKADLSIGDKTILDSLVAAHSGLPLNQNITQNVAVISQPAMAISSQPTPPPFGAKTLVSGNVVKKLYKRTTGIQASVTVANPTTILFTIPYAWCKITGANIINGEALDTINLYVLDTATGTYSTVPNMTLNQFGFNVNISAGNFQNSSPYDADLYQNMQLKIVYTSKSDKIIGINLDLHEVK